MKRQDYLLSREVLHGLRYEYGEPVSDDVSLSLLRQARPVDKPLAGGTRIVLPNGVRVWSPPSRAYKTPWWYRMLAWLDETQLGAALALVGLLAAIWLFVGLLASGR